MVQSRRVSTYLFPRMLRSKVANPARSARAAVPGGLTVSSTRVDSPLLNCFRMVDGRSTSSGPADVRNLTVPLPALIPITRASSCRWRIAGSSSRCAPSLTARDARVLADTSLSSTSTRSPLLREVADSRGDAIVSVPVGILITTTLLLRSSLVISPSIRRRATKCETGRFDLGRRCWRSFRSPAWTCAARSRRPPRLSDDIQFRVVKIMGGVASTIPEPGQIRQCGEYRKEPGDDT